MILIIYVLGHYLLRQGKQMREEGKSSSLFLCYNP